MSNTYNVIGTVLKEISPVNNEVKAVFHKNLTDLKVEKPVPVSIKFNDDSTFEKLPEGKGVYVIYNTENEVIYVGETGRNSGSSKGIRGRLETHEKK